MTPDLTLRDYFAAQALPSLLGGRIPSNIPDSKTTNVIAVAAYVQADAMLKAREVSYPSSGSTPGAVR